MDEDFFKNLPLEIIINIFTKLPISIIVRCKCVSKSWFKLIESPEFAKIHLSKSFPGLAIHPHSVNRPLICKIFEFEDSIDLEHHELHYNPIAKFDLPRPIHLHGLQGMIEGSVNGLLFVRYMSSMFDALFIYNPITRDYIELECPQDFLYEYPQVVLYGFGVSKMSGQYKVVRIFNDMRISKLECHVYTLGTGLWRRIEHGTAVEYIGYTFGAFLNGNLHWLVRDLNGCASISCFNLDAEVFSTFSTPFFLEYEKLNVGLSALRDYLCLCDNSYRDGKIVIWLMEVYGDPKSWIKKFVINKGSLLSEELLSLKVAYAIKLFKDGDILMAWQFFPVYYSNKTETIKVMNRRVMKMSNLRSIGVVNTFLHTSSFLSLKSFENEDVRSFSLVRSRIPFHNPDFYQYTKIF